MPRQDTINKKGATAAQPAAVEPEQSSTVDAATEAATATVSTNRALATTTAPQDAATEVSQYVDHSLLHNEVAVAEAIEAARAMEMSFVTYTPPEDIFAKSQAGVLFNIMDVVTVNINDPENKNGTGQKPVHVFRLESTGDVEEGLEYYTMMGVNPVRDRIADGFLKNRLIGVRMIAGPIKLGQVKVKNWKNPAWTFSSVKGFRISQLNA